MLFALTASGALVRLEMQPSSAITVVDTRTTCGEGRALAQDEAMLYLACSSTILRVPKL